MVKKFALLIGVSEYEPGLSSLSSAVKDIEALKRVLQDPEAGEFDEVQTLANPDSQVMLSAIEEFFASCSKDDVALLFFSGHGIKDDTGKLYLSSRTTRKTATGSLMRATAIPANFIQEVMSNSRAKRQVVILDCCFSGAFASGLHSKADTSIDLQAQLGAEGRVVLTSSSSTQYSFEQSQSDLSIYTRYLVEGIETGSGDRDNDGLISVRELHEYARTRVQEEAPSMTPKLIALKDMGFEIVLAKAKTTDPTLQYRRQVAVFASRGTISPIGNRTLGSLRAKLGLLKEVTDKIELEVLRPYQEYLEKRQEYKQAFTEVVEKEYPLSNQTWLELEHFQGVLGLRREDVAPIEEEILTLAREQAIAVDTQSSSQEVPATEWVIVLDASLEDTSNEKIESIIERIKYLAGDNSLKLNQVETGSIILKLEGSEEGFRIIQTLYKEGRLTELLGLPIKFIDYETTNSSSKNNIDVFFSYSHKDEDLRNQLATHLSILERDSVISGWCDRQIGAGEEWGNQIDERLNNASIILLLVSSDFIASNYCWNIEVKCAMERHETGKACVIPVILRPVNWRRAPFGKLQALPKDARPVTTWSNCDEAFLDISQGIEAVANKFIVNI